MMNTVFWIVPVSSVMALLFAYYFFQKMMKNSVGTDEMTRIALYVREG